MDTTGIEEFISALQLCIGVPIDMWGKEDDDSAIGLRFRVSAKSDPRFLLFTKLVPGNWSPDGKEYIMRDNSLIQDPHLKHFLWVSRLDKNLMRELEKEEQFLPFVRKILGETSAKENQGIVISDLQQASSLVFERIKKKGLTHRQLSEATGLTQMAISNFKIGSDIRLSNFLKILKAVGVKLKAEKE